MKQISLILATLLLATFSAYGQNPLADADKFFDAGKYEDAKRQYMLHKMNSNDRITHADTRIGQCDQCMQLLNVADYLFSNEQYAEAKANYEKVIAINSRDPHAAARLRQIPSTSEESGVVIAGVTWASRNVGESGAFVFKPEDAGHYYAFQEAQASCPAGWRTPTDAEFKSLIAAAHEWTTINGVNGRRFGSGTNSLFLPAAGVRQDANYRNLVGNYWSNTWADAANGNALMFDDEDAVYIAEDPKGASITFGFSVRCVKGTPIATVPPPAANLTTDTGVKINGTAWATRNVAARGTFAANPEDSGNYYTFDDAQTACPPGWRTPTPKELKKLVEYRSRWTKVNDVPGRWFGRDQNRIFLPGADQTPVADANPSGNYWSNAVDKVYGGSRYAFCLFFFVSGGSGLADPTDNASDVSNRYSVRCVKK